jgi:hypothetical protein
VLDVGPDAVVELVNDPARNVFELLTKNFRAMDEAVQVLSLRCWRVVAYSILGLPRTSVARRDLVVRLLVSGVCDSLYLVCARCARCVNSVGCVGCVSGCVGCVRHVA